MLNASPWHNAYDSNMIQAEIWPNPQKAATRPQTQRMMRGKRIW